VLSNQDFASRGQDSVAPRILLTDTNRWPSAARLAIVLAKAGCEVSAVCPEGHPLLHTRAVSRTFRYGSLRPVESLLAAVAAASPHIIVPCDDRGVEHLHELYSITCNGGTRGETETLVRRSLGPPQSYPVVSSRYDLLSLARAEGIRVPITASIKTVADLKRWEEQQGFPCVLKADGTFGGRGVRVAHSLKQAERFFLELNRPHPTMRVIKRLIVNRDPFWIRPWWKRTRPAMIAQAHVYGRPANCAVFCWEGRVLAGIGAEVISSDGSTGPATVIRIVENSEMMRAAERIATRLCLSGFFGLDFMIKNGTDETYLVEMNPRCTPLCHLQLGKGRDLVGALWAQLSGQPIREKAPVTQNDMIAYFPQAWALNSELLQSSFQDIPREEPGLIQELLKPWPNRSLLFRLGHALTAVNKSTD
jgi:biotin carboxylase